MLPWALAWNQDPGRCVWEMLHPVSVRRFPVFSDPAPGTSYATTYEQIYLSNPAPGENTISGNLVMETGCTAGETNDLNYSSLARPVLSDRGRPRVARCSTAPKTVPATGNGWKSTRDFLCFRCYACCLKVKKGLFCCRQMGSTLMGPPLQK